MACALVSRFGATPCSGRQAGRQAGRQPLPKPAITMQRTSQLEVVLDAGKDFGAKVLVLSRSNLAAGAVL
ncbi:hypothetical protein D3C76_1718990 [compost metagenome]